MAFPGNWIYDVYDAVPRNVAPCEIDIVGEGALYATAHQFDDTTGYIYLRMRLNADPKPFIHGPTMLSFVWGVQIKDSEEKILFTVRVNSDDNQIQVLNSYNITIYTQQIELGLNVEVTHAGENFGCTEGALDPDFFLDFRVPRIVFDLGTKPFKFCYYTSTIIGEEPYLCGPLIYPVIEIVKTIESPYPDPIHVGEEGTWNLKIEVTNLSDSEAVNVFVLDNINAEIQDFSLVLNSDHGTTVVTDKSITWDIIGLPRGETATLLIKLTGYFLSIGTKTLNSGDGRGFGVDTGLPTNPVEFEDSGITVTDQTLLNVSSILEGPDKIEVNTEGTWDLMITVENTALANLTRVASTRAVVSDIQVINEVISNLRITGTVSDPAASIAGQNVTWDIPQLEAEESKTLIITVTGSFSTEGTTGPLCIGTLAASGMETIEFMDNGIIVIQQVSPTRGIDLFTVIE